ncbi:MAG: hypothetical protein RIK85_16730 [Marinobacter sp.]
MLNDVRENKARNTALVQISFKLGLRVQEIALLQIKDVAELGPESSGQRSFKLKEILALPAAYTKGADALKRSKGTNMLVSPATE